MSVTLFRKRAGLPPHTDDELRSGKTLSAPGVLVGHQLAFTLSKRTARLEPQPLPVCVRNPLNA